MKLTEKFLFLEAWHVYTVGLLLIGGSGMVWGQLAQVPKQARANKAAEKEMQPAKPEKVAFDSGRFEIVYPAEWSAEMGDEKNINAQNEDAPLSVRRSKNGKGSFLVSKMTMKKGADADLYAIYWKMWHHMEERGIQAKERSSADALPGMVDGKQALFATVPAKIQVAGRASELTLYFVLVDCGDCLIVLQANLAHPLEASLQKSCLKVIHSFREHQQPKKEE